MEIITPTTKCCFQGKWCDIIKVSDREQIGSEHFTNMNLFNTFVLLLYNKFSWDKAGVLLVGKKISVVTFWENIIHSFHIHHCAYGKDVLTGLRSQSNKIRHLNSICVLVALGNFDVTWLSALVCNYKFKYDNFPWSLWNVTSYDTISKVCLLFETTKM